MTIEKLREMIAEYQRNISASELLDMDRRKIAAVLESLGVSVYVLPKRTLVHVDGVDYVQTVEWDEREPRIVLSDPEAC